MAAGPGAGVRKGQVFQIVEARGGNETGVWHGDFRYRRQRDWTDEQWECFTHALDGARDDDHMEAAIQVVGHGPEEMPYVPQGPARFDERVSAIEWTLLAKIREMTPSGADADRIEVLEKFLLRAENQGQGLVSDRLIKLEAAVDTIEDIRRFGPRTFY
jgi:hypothetical protein